MNCNVIKLYNGRLSLQRLYNINIFFVCDRYTDIKDVISAIFNHPNPDVQSHVRIGKNAQITNIILLVFMVETHVRYIKLKQHFCKNNISVYTTHPLFFQVLSQCALTLSFHSLSTGRYIYYQYLCNNTKTITCILSLFQYIHVYW